ncbi:copper transporter complex subunit Ctr4 [Neofusicoccum ribis]|uniref:Copper transport protein n=1 Tax=Neofusicoccum ribis TaxID=45134 RepID=A0ABR3SJL6_9PEZI
MLWNWYTVDSCFIARSWHVRSAGAFAGSCIGVILLVISLELLRRAQRELDRHFRRTNRAASAPAVAAEAGSSASSAKAMHPAAAGLAAAAGVAPLRWWQHLLRSLLFMVQFAVGYFVMLLAMYYNGYIIICIFIGAFLGAAMFQWDTYYAGAE